MKIVKKMIVTTTVAMLGLSSQNLECQEYFASNLGGFGYEESRDAPSMAPAAVLGIVALGAIIAVGLQGMSSHGHSHVDTQ